MGLQRSLQERIVSEIESTYTSIAAYKNRAFDNHNENGVIAKKRVELIEHKLKALKMMLARVDDGDYMKCEKCEQPILINRLLNKPLSSICTKCAS